jgi:hypothetical protein
MSDDLGIAAANPIDLLMYRLLGTHLVRYPPPHPPGRHLIGNHQDLEAYERANRKGDAPA